MFGRLTRRFQSVRWYDEQTTRRSVFNPFARFSPSDALDDTMLISLSHLTARLVALVALAAAPLGAADGQAVPSDSAIRTALRMRVDSGTAKGIVVGIVEKGQRRYVAYGSAGPGRWPIDEHTLFEIGSISKTFNALLLAGAVARGELQLDQPVVRLLPAGTAVPSRGGREITLEQLATHRSGLPRMPDNFAPAVASDPYADYDTKRMYAYLAGHKLTRAPGDSAEYSNLGAGLLGHALALRAGAASWAVLVNQRITGPLGMRETFVDVPAALRPRLSSGFNAELDSVAAWNMDALAGAGALRSTAADMLTYLAAHLDTTNGPLARAVALARPPRADFAGGVRVALGWLVNGDAPRRMWWHNGGTGGFRSFAAFDPERQIGVVVLANSTVSVDDIGSHVLNPSIPVGLPVRAPRTAVTVSAATLDRLVGEYPLSPAFVLTVTRDGDAIFVQATGQPKLRLTTVSENHFVIPAANAELVFNTSEPGPARHVTLKQNGGTVTGPRKP